MDTGFYVIMGFCGRWLALLYGPPTLRRLNSDVHELIETKLSVYKKKFILQKMRRFNLKK